MRRLRLQLQLPRSSSTWDVPDGAASAHGILSLSSTSSSSSTSTCCSGSSVSFKEAHVTSAEEEFDKRRSSVVTSLVWVWSVRLTHSYFRREHWQWGEREDWRFSQLRNQHPRHWWWMSFFAAYLSQHVFLIGITLPLYAVHTTAAPWSLRDALAASLCVTGIVIAWFADTQLHGFMRKNAVLREPVPVLQEGVWRYSRHPNYVGEQLWWWGLALFARSGWMVAGAAVNTACLAYVTVLVERKMVERESRAAAYRRYQQTTSVWIPWRVSGKNE